jgi:hypothetical protein
VRVIGWAVVLAGVGVMWRRQAVLEQRLSKRQDDFEAAVDLAIRAWAKRTVGEIERAMGVLR